MLTRRKLIAAVLTAGALGATAIGLSVSSAASGPSDAAANYATTTPIKHLVVIYGENISFDHYFGTYPTALNPSDEPQFNALPGTPTVNGLNTSLLDSNPNEDLPERLDPTQAVTCDQNHGYSAEQSAFDGGLMDKFVQDTQGTGCTQTTYPDNSSYGPNGIVMDYYDGNTVTALWNYAQHFTLNDNSYSTQFGPSTPGAINVVSGQTHGATAEGGTTSSVANSTDIGDQDPYYDLCSNPTLPLGSTDPNTGVPAPGGVTLAMSGQNIGNLLNSKSISWGWFEGGFTPSSYSSGRPICGTAHSNVGGASTADYVQHHEPFQYYASTANPYHNSPSSVTRVGLSDPAGTSLSAAVNHQYDVSWFNKTLTEGNMPAVSYLKAPAYQDGHAGYSDPLDEQRFLVDEINTIEESKFWPSTAIVLAYDDSDGWYDHQMGSIIRPSEDINNDTLNGAGKCGSSTNPPAINDRCGVGPRQPLLVISPWAKQNYVDNTFTEQASIVRFIEDNWSLGRIGNDSADASAGTLMNAFNFNQSSGGAPAIILNDTTGEVEQTIEPDGTTVAGSAPTTATYKSSNPLANESRSLPKVSCGHSVRSHTIVVTCKTKGSAKVATTIRARVYHGRKLIKNVAHSLRHAKVRFSLNLGRRAQQGKYKVTLSIDQGGVVSSMVRGVRLS